MKPVSFSDYKKVQKFTYNQFNVWLQKFYKVAFNDGCEYAESHVEGKPVSDEEIFNALRAEKIGIERANRIIDKFFKREDN